jgi:glycopeptide antibiotics resistance protein
MVKEITLDSRFALVVGVAVWIIVRSLILWKDKKYKLVTLKRELFISIFAIYIIGVISVTLFPFEIYWGDAPTRFNPRINLVPFTDIVKDFNYTYFSFAFKLKLILKNLFGNLLLLLPLGIFVPSLWTRSRNLWKTALIGLSISFFIEVSQFILAYLGHSRGRASDIDDLILNTLGTIIGYLAFDKVFVRYNIFLQLSKGRQSQF